MKAPFSGKNMSSLIPKDKNTSSSPTAKLKPNYTKKTEHSLKNTYHQRNSKKGHNTQNSPNLHGKNPKEHRDNKIDRILTPVIRKPGVTAGSGTGDGFLSPTGQKVIELQKK